MRKLRFRHEIDRMPRARSFQGVRHALRMILYAFTPIVFVFFIFQCLLPTKAVALTNSRPAVAGHNLAPLFNYYVAWAAHVLISIGVGLGAARGAIRNTTEPQKIVLRRLRIMTLVFA